MIRRQIPADFGPAFETSLPSAFANTAKYLSAVAELAHTANGSPDAIAQKNELDATFLKQWVKVLAVGTSSRRSSHDARRRFARQHSRGEAAR